MDRVEFQARRPERPAAVKKGAVRFGLWAAFWDDTSRAARQLFDGDGVDYLAIAAVGVGQDRRQRLHDVPGRIRRWSRPGSRAVNIISDNVLGGQGGTSTLRYDPQGESYAAMLLTLPVTVPFSWDHDGLLATENGRSARPLAAPHRIR